MRPLGIKGIVFHRGDEEKPLEEILLYRRGKNPVLSP